MMVEPLTVAAVVLLMILVEEAAPTETPLATAIAPEIAFIVESSVAMMLAAPPTTTVEAIVKRRLPPSSVNSSSMIPACVVLVITFAAKVACPAIELDAATPPEELKMFESFVAARLSVSPQETV